MDALDVIHDSITEQAFTCDIYRPSGDGPYDDGMSAEGTVKVAISAVTSQSELFIEGNDQDISMVGHVVPEYTDGTLDDPLKVNDELRVQNTAKRYAVKTKHGAPNEIDPELWVLGLEPSNSSE